MPRTSILSSCLAVLLMALVSPLRAVESNTASAEPPECDPALALVPRGLLDEAADADAREQAAEELRRLAVGGNRRARFMLGSMLRAGDLIPGNPVERDLDRAAIYLSHAALDGRFDAMLVLAELELERGRPLQALVWTQVYLSIEQQADHLRAPQAYTARLIDRSRDALARGEGIPDDVTIRGLVQTFLDTHGDRIAEALPSQDYQRESAWLAWDSSRHRNMPSRDRPKRAGIATFAIQVAPDGRVLEAQVLDAMPERHHAAYLGKVLRKGSFNAIPQGAEACRGYQGPRVDLLTLSLDDGSRLLGIDH